MKKLFSLFTLSILALSALYADDECVATYGVASVTFTRDGSQYKTGHFSVSATKSVKFSPGNLAYSTSTEKFYFLENQYSCLHREDGYGGTATGEIDLFGYGASGGTVGGKTVSPSCKDDNDSSYASGDLVGEQSDWDWGVHNGITHEKGGQTTTYDAGMWRTLTWDEWNYLSNQRTNHAFLITGARVDGRYGIILLPDDWVAPANLPNMVPSMPFKDIPSESTVNTYNISEWSIFENAGAVFIPALGNSGGYDNAYCCYWSSKQKDDTHAIRVDFGNDDRGVREVDAEKKIRSSVRLVQDW